MTVEVAVTSKVLNTVSVSYWVMVDVSTSVAVTWFVNDIVVVAVSVAMATVDDKIEVS